MGMVIDKRTLTKTATSLAGVLGPLITYLLAAVPAPGDTSCTLSAVHASTIQAMLSDRNSSCVYNVTLDSILAGVV